MHWYGWSWGSWILMTAVMVAFWGFVAWAVVSLLRTPSPIGDPNQTPEDVLRRRFAAGEIDEREYNERLETLRSNKVGVR